MATAVRRRGDASLHVGPWDHDQLGGVTDRSYRRQDAYVGVGAKLKRVAGAAAERGLRIDEPRPPRGRAATPHRPAEASEAGPGDDVSPEDLAAQGTAG